LARSKLLLQFFPPRRNPYFSANFLFRPRMTQTGFGRAKRRSTTISPKVPVPLFLG
jgi:hypothetical protein